MEFRFSSRKPIEQYNEAKELGIQTKPVLVGPLTFLLRASPRVRSSTGWSCSTISWTCTPRCLRELGKAGAEWVQFDEPVLVEDRTAGRAGRARARLQEARRRRGRAEDPDRDVLRPRRRGLSGAHAPADRRCRARLRLRPAQPRAGRSSTAGRRTRRCSPASSTAATCGSTISARAWTCSTSCASTPATTSWCRRPRVAAALAGRQDQRAAARRRGAELDVVRRAEARRGGGADARAERGPRRDLGASSTRTTKALEDRRNSPRTRNPQVRERLAKVDRGRRQPREPVRHAPRRAARAARPAAVPDHHDRLLPADRGDPHRAGAPAQGRDRRRQVRGAACEGEIERVIRLQEEIGLDVLVHGESERNDMVEYFGEQTGRLRRSPTTRWVQSYGSRCVRPPIIFGDVSRPEPMTVDWIEYAQSLTRQAGEGHAHRSGDDPAVVVRARRPAALARRASRSRSRSATRSSDLEAAGIDIIQVDEPAIREGLPLRRDRWDEYLELGGRLPSACRVLGVRDETQIHTHMCYSEFDDIIEPIAADGRRRDADRGGALRDGAARRLEAHGLRERDRARASTTSTPRACPPTEEMVELLRLAAQVLEPEQLWVEPRLRPEDPPLRGGRAVAARTWWRRRSSCARSWFRARGRNIGRASPAPSPRASA